MPLDKAQAPSCEECSGFTWIVGNEALLASLVANLIAGHYRYVSTLLNGGEPRTFKIPASVVAKLKKQLGPQPLDALRYHRDGWLFQLISWVAAHRTLPPNSAMLAPHMQPAHKGIDTFAVEWDYASPALAAVTIGEDKATENPRKTVREKIWPELEEWESGERDNELVSATTMVLESAKVPDPEILTENVFWKNLRRYRVCITAPPPDNEDTRKELFSGYSTKVPGKTERRRGDVCLSSDVRAWLEAFAAKVIAALEAAEGA